MTVPSVLSRTNTSVIGVDFGACSVRAVQLSRHGERWRLHHWVNIESEPTGAEPPAIDYREQVRMAFGPATFTGKRTALVLSPPSVEFRLIDAPAVLMGKPNAELRAALQLELDRHMPWPAAESEVAAWPIKPDACGTTCTMVVAARTASVEQWLDVLESQQLGCVRADVVPNAIIRVCPRPGDAERPEGETGVWGVLDIGFGSARFYLIHADRPVYARVLRGGGRELTETIAEALHVDFRIAEQYKRIYGIRKGERGFRSVAGGLTRIDEEQLPAVLYAVLRSTIEAMARDMERSFQFALGQLPGTTAGPVYLIGGGARLGGLADALSAELGVPVLLPDPKRTLDTASTQPGGGEHPACTPGHFPALAACAGLAMMGEDGS